MAAYVIAQQEVTDPVVFEEYVRGMGELIPASNGRFLARGGATELVVGDQEPHRLVLVEFESLEAAQAYTRSAEYQRLGEIRDRSCNASVIIVDGV